MTAYASGDIVTTHTHMRRVRLGTAQFRQGGALALILAALTATSACTKGDSPEGPAAGPTASTSSQAAPSPTKESPEETAKKEAVSAYLAYWHEMERVYAGAALNGTDITKYAAGPALTRPRVEAAHLRKVGRVLTGKVSVTNPTATQTNLDAKLPSVRLSSCLDISAWKVIDTKTKKPVATPTKRLTKYVIVTTVERWKDGWKVITDEPKEQAC
ncbi:hypothetical protein ACFVZH_38705 [Streptomyces sp. NPDC059534]|uniref:hypothetical protein n=1 Tax=Streptomyces sp. NPDC059534 TaxID=3346859 RepID=UPI0036CD13E4